jgi:hypothetical protein
MRRLVSVVQREVRDRDVSGQVPGRDHLSSEAGAPRRGRLCAVEQRLPCLPAADDLPRGHVTMLDILVEKRIETIDVTGRQRIGEGTSGRDRLRGERTDRLRSQRCRQRNTAEQ